MSAPQSFATDTIDLAEVLGRIRRRWAWVVGSVVLGVALALAITSMMPPRYEASSRVLVRSSEEGASPALSRISGLAGVIPGMGGGGGVETEMLVMTSRTVLEAVVDTLGLQAKVVKPAGTRPDQLFARALFAREIAPATRLHFAREGGAYRVTGPALSRTVRPGERLVFTGGSLTLRGGSLPDEFTVDVLDMRDAVGAVQEELNAADASTDVVQLTYSAADGVTAARVLNVLVEQYLARRNITSRGVNRYRYDFLVAHTDSIAAELTAAENALRRQQETSGFVDPEVYGKGEYERAMTLQAETEALEVEMRALRSILAGRTPSTAELAAYPTFLRNPAINDLLGRILEVQTRRRELLERRTEADPEVMTADQTVRDLEAQLASLSRSYLSGLERQSAQTQQALGRYRSTLTALPAQAQQSLRLQREVRRLQETLVGLQTQMVQTRLAALGEGGAVQQIDPAVVPRKQSSPRPLVNLAIGLIGGLLLGIAAALLRSYLDGRVRTAYDARSAAGVPALVYDPRAPLVLGNAPGGVLLVAVGAAARTGDVARTLVDTARLQGRDAELLDADASAMRPEVAAAARGRVATAEPPSRNGTGDGHSAGELREALRRAEGERELVVVALGAADAPGTVAVLSAGRRALLVARAGVVSRHELREAASSLARAGVETSGVVLLDAKSGGTLRA